MSARRNHIGRRRWKIILANFKKRLARCRSPLCNTLLASNCALEETVIDLLSANAPESDIARLAAMNTDVVNETLKDVLKGYV